jgi:hypothetical protein
VTKQKWHCYCWFVLYLLPDKRALDPPKNILAGRPLIRHKKNGNRKLTAPSAATFKHSPDCTCCYFGHQRLLSIFVFCFLDNQREHDVGRQLPFILVVLGGLWHGLKGVDNPASSSDRNISSGFCGRIHQWSPSLEQAQLWLQNPDHLGQLPEDWH